MIALRLLPAAVLMLLASCTDERRGAASPDPAPTVSPRPATPLPADSPRQGMPVVAPDTGLQADMPVAAPPDSVEQK